MINKALEKIKTKFKDNSLFIIIFLFSITIILLPFMQNNLVYGDDMIFHLSRIQSIADSIKNKVFPIKINASMANGFGYASSLFYPDLFLYFPAFLIAFFNISLIYSYKIFISLLLISMFLIFYYSFKYLSNNKEIALLGTVFLMFSKVVILTLYSRFALGEFIGFIFILPAIVGMYDYIYKGFRRPQILVLSFLGLINSHLITGLIVLSFCIIVFIIDIRNSFKNPKKFLKLFVCAIFVLLMSMYFWAPLIEQLAYQKFRFSDSWTNIGNDTYTIYDYFLNSKYSIGYSVIFTMPFVIYMFFYNKDNYSKSNEWKMYLIFFILLSILLVSSPVWKKFNNELNIIQFKWRLLGIINTIYCVSLVLLISEYKEYFYSKNPKAIILILFSVLVIFALGNFNNYSIGNLKYNNDDILNNISTNIESIGGGFEYLPIEINSPLDIFQKNTNSSFVNSTNILGIKYPNHRYNLSYEGEKGDIIEIPYIYYYGYVANIKDKEGIIKPLKVFKGSSGLVNLKIENEDSGEICVWYNGTKIQKISLIVSVLSVFIYIIILFYDFKKNKILALNQ